MYKSSSWDQAKLIGWTLKNLPLTNPPGEHWASLELRAPPPGAGHRNRSQAKLTPGLYACKVRLLAPCGISGMRIAGVQAEGARTQPSGAPSGSTMRTLT